MKPRSISVEQIVTQCILIVFSVVLGIYLSERIEERKKKREAAVLLTKIKSELKDNISLLNEWVPYHQQINNHLDSLSEEPVFIEEFITNKYILLEKLLTKGSFMGRMPASDAWDIAKSHPLIVNIDYDKLLILSRIYNQQELTFEPGLEMFNLFNSKDVNIRKDAKPNLELMLSRINELTARERQLMYYYQQAEEILNLQDNWEVEN
ncbi:MAG: hypothetical protein AAF694_19140 [Bacteroidota bacterium]